MCWATFTAILDHMQPIGHGLDTPDYRQFQAPVELVAWAERVIVRPDMYNYVCDKHCTEINRMM